MTEWYYSQNSQQQGPVSFDRLVEIARNGGLHPVKDLVWNSTMKDWTPSGQVPGLFQPQQATSPMSGPPPAQGANPYATPGSAWGPSAPVLSGEALEEIVPGSEPIDIMACVKRGFTLTGRHFGIILLVGLSYIGITLAADFIFSLMDENLGLKPIQSPTAGSNGGGSQQQGSPLNILLSQALSVFLSLGVTRIGLNLVSGQAVSLGMLFGGGSKWLRAALATLLFAIMVGVGLLLLIVPGIYLALKYGQFQAAIVDRNLGVIDAFKYSSEITKNNRMNLFGLALVSVLISLAGCLALMVGLLFALPVIWLSWAVAYRWMQYGNRVVQDHPGTTRPMLANL